MKHVERTVFISYRRTNFPWALAIFQELTHNGYDVFIDYQGIASGDFEKVILENIEARAHFLVLLTPSAMERCGEPGDWLRREIEAALDSRRNIVPILLDGFTFSTPSIASQLNGKLAALKSYNALQVPNAFFFDAMIRLREKYLNISLEAVPHPASALAQQAAKDQQIAAGTAPTVQDSDLAAQQWFEQGFNADDAGEKLRCYNKVIELKPSFSYAYRTRGQVRHEQGDLGGALQDFAEAIRLEPSNPHNYSSLGIVLAEKGKFDYALANMNEAVRREPTTPFYYFNRALVNAANDDLEGAIRDLDEAIRIEPLFAPDFYDVRGRVLSMNGDFGGALKDYSELIRLRPNDPNPYGNRALVLEKTNYYSEAIRDLQKYLALGGGRRNGDQAEMEELIGKLSKQLDA